MSCLFEQAYQLKVCCISVRLWKMFAFPYKGRINNFLSQQIMIGTCRGLTSGKNQPYLALLTTVMYCSSAIVMDGACVVGARISIFNPASFTA